MSAKRKIVKSNYQNLIGNISHIYEKTQQILVEANWEIGRVIVKDEQLNSDRAEYGAEVIARLSDDLTDLYGVGFSIRNLRNMRQFFLTYQIRHARAEFSWTQYVYLISIKDDDARKEIEARAIDEKLSTRELLDVVKQAKLDLIKNSESDQKEATKQRKIRLDRGTLNQYSLKNSDSANKTNIVDCGFHIYREIPIRSSGKSVLKPSHTYLASVDRVVDGDTLLVTVDCGFKTQTVQRLRLRGIDAPEIKTKEGEKSRRFVQKILKNCAFVVIRTFQIDMYARYIADILYLPDETNSKIVAAEGHFLNQDLLDAGMAVGY